MLTHLFLDSLDGQRTVWTTRIIENSAIAQNQWPRGALGVNVAGSVDIFGQARPALPVPSIQPPTCHRRASLAMSCQGAALRPGRANGAPGSANRILPSPRVRPRRQSLEQGCDPTLPALAESGLGDAAVGKQDMSSAVPRVSRLSLLSVLSQRLSTSASWESEPSFSGMGPQMSTMLESRQPLFAQVAT